MRIISNKRDYYDGWATYDKTYKTKVWVRRPQEIEYSKYKLETFTENRVWINSRAFHIGYLIIAGIVYPYIEYESLCDEIWYKGKWIKENNKEDKFFYDYETLMSEHGDFLKKHCWNDARDIKNFFEQDQFDMTEMCLELDAPIILIEFKKFPWRLADTTKRVITINPNLKEISLSKVFSSPQMYQILDRFVSNVMVGDKTPTSKQTDIEKVEAHGFDKKISFRKGKQKK